MSERSNARSQDLAQLLSHAVLRVARTAEECLARIVERHARATQGEVRYREWIDTGASTARGLSRGTRGVRGAYRERIGDLAIIVITAVVSAIILSINLFKPTVYPVRSRYRVGYPR